MEEKLLPPYGGSNRKKIRHLRSQKKHTQMQHLNESQRYTIYRMRKDKKTPKAKSLGYFLFFSIVSKYTFICR